MSVVVLLIDAIRDDYLTPADTPFLCHMAKTGEYIRKLYPSLGFCERVEILTGQVPAESGYLMAYGYDPARSAYRGVPGLKALHAIESVLGRSSKWRRRFRSRMARLFRMVGITTSPSRIPADFLPFFALTEDGFPHDSYHGFGAPSILDSVVDAGGTFDYSTFTALGMENGTDNHRLETALARAGDAHALRLVYQVALDEGGHHFGPKSVEMKKRIREMDTRIERFVTQYIRKAPETRFIVIGDHGMVPVDRWIDVEAKLLECAAAAGLVRVRDFLYFLDSTVMRLWFNSERAKTVLTAMIRDSAIFQGNGFVLARELAYHFRAPWNDRRYGDLAWWTNPGAVISPDFFHVGEKILGMHGYDPACEGQQTMLIHWGKGVLPTERPVGHLYEVPGIVRTALSKSGDRRYRQIS